MQAQANNALFGPNKHVPTIRGNVGKECIGKVFLGFYTCMALFSSDFQYQNVCDCKTALCDRIILILGVLRKSTTF